MNDYTIDDFTDDVWMTVSEDVISNKYIDENSDYFRELLFYFYQKRLDGFSLEVIGEIMTKFFETSFKYKPRMQNILDDDYDLV